MRQLLQTRCWKCREIFTMSAEPQTEPPGANRVDVLVPCPYCDTSNRVTITADQVRIVTVHKGAGAAVDLSQPDALYDQIFDGQEPAH